MPTAKGIHCRIKLQADRKNKFVSAASIIGADLCAKVEKAALQLYKEAADYALTRGLILADTKFEFGLVPSSDGSGQEELILVDEALTPDSSRYWPADAYKPGGGQPSFDKQYLRDWLVREGLKGKEGVRMSDEVAQKTSEKYKEAWEKLTGGN